MEQNQGDYEIVLQQLVNQIGINDITQMTLVDDTKNFNTVDVNLDQLKAKALKERLEIQQAQITIKKAERTWAQATNQELPAVNLSYNSVSDSQSYSTSYNFLSGDIAWNAYQKNKTTNQSVQIPGLNNNHDYFGATQQNIALRFTWTLDFGVARNQAAEAKVSLENAKIALKQTTQNINLDLDQAIVDYKIALKKTATNQKAIPYYQKDLEIKKLQYQLGTVTRLDVAAAEFSLSQAQIAVVKSSYDQLVAYQKLKLVSGELYLFSK